MIWDNFIQEKCRSTQSLGRRSLILLVLMQSWHFVLKKVQIFPVKVSIWQIDGVH